MEKNHAPKDLDEFHHGELETFRRAFTERPMGNEAGLYDALVYCRKNTIPLPGWALDASIIRQRDYILGETKRHAKWLRQFKADMVDQARYEMVEEIRGHGAKGRKVYEYAARFLAGTENEGKKDAIEQSCKRFRRTMKTNPYRYYIPRYIRLKECHAPLAPRFVEWLDRKFPFPKEGGPRRYK